MKKNYEYFHSMQIISPISIFSKTMKLVYLPADNPSANLEALFLDR